MNETPWKYPDDDGKLKRAWVRGAEERGSSACERVYEVLSERSWVSGEIVVTEANSQDDVDGFDIFVPMDKDLMKTLGIRAEKLGVPIQVKSSDHAVRGFLKTHRVLKNGKLVFRRGEYIFAFNGHNPKDLILADLVGQMVILAQEVMTEEEFLVVLESVFEDKEAVTRWLENREIIKDSWWYKDLLE